MTPREILRKARAGTGLTIKQAAKKIGIPFTTLSSWERGVSYPRAKNREKTAAFYGIDPKTIAKPEKPVPDPSLLEDYDSKVVMLHKERWVEAEELFEVYDVKDVSSLFDRMLSDAKMSKNRRK